MTCICGDPACWSCGPAQGFDPAEVMLPEDDDMKTEKSLEQLYQDIAQYLDRYDPRGGERLYPPDAYERLLIEDALRGFVRMQHEENKDD